MQLKPVMILILTINIAEKHLVTFCMSMQILNQESVYHFLLTAATAILFADRKKLVKLFEEPTDIEKSPARRGGEMVFTQRDGKSH